MQYSRLGKSGLKVSRLCLGCMSFGAPGDPRWPWALGESDARPFFKRAVETGINFFDTADAYSHGRSEEVTGRLIKELLPRSEAVIATKVFNSLAAKPGPNDAGLSRKHIMDAIDGSLKRLGTDYVDLYIIHRFDRRTPIEETMEALHDVVKAGKARYLGASSMYAFQFVQMQYEALRHSWTPFVSMQNLYNLAWREEERGMNDFCVQTGVGLTPWSPLAGGFLATDWRARGEERSERAKAGTSYSAKTWGTPEDYRVVDVLKEVAAGRQVGMSQVALAWLLAQPGVTAPIVGATKIAQLDQAIAALDLHLTPDELKRLGEAYTFNRSLGLLR